MITKADRIKEYNQINKGYNITGIKKVPTEHLQWLSLNGAKTLRELYKSFSWAKQSSYDQIMRTYKPIEVIGLEGNSMAYSITLKAENGDILWITRANNYLVEEKE